MKKLNSSVHTTGNSMKEKFLDIRIVSWWRMWVVMVNMICCMDFIYIFMITYVVRINMIMHNTTFVKSFDHSWKNSINSIFLNWYSAWTWLLSKQNWVCRKF
jgi:hypothetical protein